MIEGSAVAAFMVSAVLFASVLYHPSSPVAAGIANEWLRRGLMGLAMGATAITIIYSPWGQRSGAHMNPAITVTFLRLGRVGWRDCLGYVAAQFAGGIAGIAMAAVAFRPIVSHPAVNYVATTPGPFGDAAAFAAEVAISFGMMLMVLVVSNHDRWSRFTGLCAGLLVWAYIVVEQPLSGMSMNPARTFGSALLAHDYFGLWIYFTAPLVGMLLAAELFRRRFGIERVVCAKLHHPRGGRCIFGCAERPDAPRMARSA